MVSGCAYTCWLGQYQDGKKPPIINLKYKILRHKQLQTNGHILEVNLSWSPNLNEILPVHCYFNRGFTST